MKDWREQQEESFLFIFSFLSNILLDFSIQLLSLGLLSPKSNVILERRKKQVKINKKLTHQKYRVRSKKKISKTKVKIKMVLNFEMQLNNVVF